MLALVAVAGLSAGVAGCAIAEAGGARPGVTQRAPTPLLHATIASGAQQVGIVDPLVIVAVGGTLTTVTVTGKAGRPVNGVLSADRTRWTSEPLAYDVAYTVEATGMGSAGNPIAPLKSTFHTVRPRRTLQVDAFRPTNGQVVGVAMPVSIYFNHPVRDKAAVERKLSVVTSTPTVGSFNWIGDDQVNWRPKEFWAAGTKVEVTAALRGVDAGSGTFGGDDARSAFTVGARHEAVGDVAAHTLTLFEDGRPVRTMPASFGRPQYPTQYGMHVAFEKHLSKRMRSDSWGGPKEGEPGFYDEILPLAVRISGNGEFVHVNSATVGVQGRYNVSHGCANLSPANGRIFYDWVQIGDPVNIVGSTRPLTPKDGDISDWLVPWDQYTAGSALHTPPPVPGVPLAPVITRVTQ
ncbi:MAG TPA: Ig-like domain-containing protein [Pseudonocardia sp.]|nr:Ig-like domain-containing protein [Pseudonocardia sp.]